MVSTSRLAADTDATDFAKTTEWSRHLSPSGTSGSFSLLANVSAGGDLEGDDRKGNVAFTLARELGRSTQLGIAVNAETDLGSTDARRTARGDSIYEGFAGAVGTCTIGQWALLIEAGPSVIKSDRIRSGIVSLGGAATAF